MIRAVTLRVKTTRSDTTVQVIKFHTIVTCKDQCMGEGDVANINCPPKN